MIKMVNLPRCYVAPLIIITKAPLGVFFVSDHNTDSHQDLRSRPTSQQHTLLRTIVIVNFFVRPTPARIRSVAGPVISEVAIATAV